MSNITSRIGHVFKIKHAHNKVQIVLQNNVIYSTIKLLIQMDNN
jgi:hypothetical protein